MARLFGVIVLGLIGACIIHILIVLLVPVYSDRNAWFRITELGESYRFHPLISGISGAKRLAEADPLFMESACWFDLDEGPVHFTAMGTAPYWSISVYNRSGDNLYSFNDSISSERTLDLILADAASMARLKPRLPDDFPHSVPIEQDIDEGIVVLRVFVPDLSWKEQATDFLANARCTALSTSRL